MQPLENKTAFYYQAYASSLGGELYEPLRKPIPSQASVALPVVGGFAAARTGAFNHDELITCSAAYTRISGRALEGERGSSILATSVIEELNILDSVTARRIVAQLSIETSADGRQRRISLAGSHFEGLRLAGLEVFPPIESRPTDP